MAAEFASCTVEAETQKISDTLESARFVSAISDGTTDCSACVCPTACLTCLVPGTVLFGIRLGPVNCWQGQLSYYLTGPAVQLKMKS